MGDEPLDELYAAVYGDLRRRAARWVAGQPGVDPASLVHEAHLRLARSDARFEDRGHFCAVAALAMRQVLVDRARARQADKRGGDWQRVTLTGVASGGEADVDVLALEAALAELEALEPRHAEVVTLRFFGGLTVDEIAAHLGVSRSTVEADWRKARAFLAAALR
jgi:RNA polymerase sigma-70 factor, ECF subfamily